MTKTLYELWQAWLEAEDVCDAAWAVWYTSADKTEVNGAHVLADEAAQDAYNAYLKAKEAE